MKSRQAGLTIIELLIAATIMLVILGAALSIYTSAVRANRTTTEVSEQRQEIQAAVALLQYEISLAGYRCVDAGAATRSLAGTPLTVIDGGSGDVPDRIIVRYHEDRYVAGCTSQVVEFYVQDDTLFRRGPDGAAVAAIENVTNLQVRHWLDQANAGFKVPTDRANVNRPADKVLRGIGIELTLARETVGGPDTETVLVTVGLPNPQCQVLADCY